MSNLFHDLKNQLTIVLGIAHLILDTADGLTYDNVKIIYAAGNKMNEMLATDDNIKASCGHVYDFDCNLREQVCEYFDIPTNDERPCRTCNYCPDCGQQLMKGK